MKFCLSFSLSSTSNLFLPLFFMFYSQRFFSHNVLFLLFQLLYYSFILNEWAEYSYFLFCSQLCLGSFDSAQFLLMLCHVQFIRSSKKSIMRFQISSVRISKIIFSSHHRSMIKRHHWTDRHEQKKIMNIIDFIGHFTEKPRILDASTSFFISFLFIIHYFY